MRFALGWREKLLVTIFAAAGALWVAVMASRGLTRAVCGEWPTRTGNDALLVRVIGVLSGDLLGWVGSAADGCRISNASAWVLVMVVVLVVVFALLALFQYFEARRLTPQYLRKQLLARKEVFAGRGEVKREVGADVAVDRGRKVRPKHAEKVKRRFKPEDAAFHLGKSQGVDVFLSMEDAVLLIGPPRSGKGYGILTRQIIETPGPVVTTSTRGDNMEATIAARAKKGPVYVLDPENVTGRRSTMKWSPITGCENGVVARKRAQLLVDATGLGAGEGGNNQEFATKAVEILQALLHAAAVGKVSLSEVYAWTKNPERAREAVEILATESDLGWDESLRATLELPVEQRATNWFGVSSALTPVDVPETRGLFQPDDGEVFNIDDFLDNNGTLYLISPLKAGNEGASVGVLLVMLLDAITEAAHRKAMMQPSGRLDPPLGLVLDELANVFPWPQLPQWCAAGSGEGIQVTSVVQSRSQLRSGWGQDGAQTVWESSGIKIILGGGGADSDLREAIALLDEQTWKTTHASWSTERDESWNENVQMKEGMTVAELRRLPELMALIIVRRARAIAVDLIPWTQKKDVAELVAESKRWHKDHGVSSDPSNPGETYLSVGQRKRVKEKERA